MKADVVLLPRDLRPEHLSRRSVVVLDVLRATTTMIAALAAGVSEIHLFGDLESARTAARQCQSPRILCGERNAIRPPDFDLGNSPNEFVPGRCEGLIAYMTTTNGTRAILAARQADRVFPAALINAGAVARTLQSLQGDVTLLCAGTEGHVSSEDVIGAGAVIHELRRLGPLAIESDVAWMAERLFLAVRTDLVAALSASRGGENVIRAGLAPDIAFCARLNAVDVVGVVERDQPVVRKFQSH